MLCLVVGTSTRRTSSSAACTDQASRVGRDSNASMASGEGPTVDTEMCEFPRRKPSTMVRAARCTCSRLSAGSPMPMKTTFVSGGSSLLWASCMPAKSCPRISCASRDRMSPMAPVEQNAQARAQPTWLETQIVVRESVGMSTVSAMSPSCRCTRIFVVPSAATSPTAASTPVHSSPRAASRGNASRKSLAASLPSSCGMSMPKGSNPSAMVFHTL
mmetsp:Transcript_13849/g.40561  ORF Transcript_13849/g.40561 Transcript_13849/m.40561 type:complete len:216 (-) Transcript_13849:169-816(-)